MKQHQDDLATDVDCRLRLLVEELSSSGLIVCDGEKYDVFWSEHKL